MLDATSGFSRSLLRAALAAIACAAAEGSFGDTEVRGKLREDTTWTRGGSPYLVRRPLVIREGVTLRVEPGVVVRAVGKRSSIVVHGALVAAGTPEEPVVFTSLQDSGPGSWLGIRFERPGGPVRSSLVGVEIRNAGSSAFQKFSRPASVAANVSGLVIRDSTIADGGGDGIRLEDGARADVSATEVRNHAGYAVWTQDPDSTAGVIEGIVATGNRPDAIRVAGQLDVSATWASGVPFVLDDDVVVASGARLTLLPGAVVKGATPDRELRARGRIVAKGTASEPIVFTSIEDDSAGGDTNGDGGSSSPAPGGWMGLAFEGHLGGGGGVLEQIEVRHAGGHPWKAHGRPAAIVSEVSDLAVRDSRILRSAGEGILLALGAWPRIERTSIRESAGYAVFMIAADSARAALVGNEATGNGVDGIALGGTLALSATLGPDLPYVVDRSLDVHELASLTVEPGVVVKFAPGSARLRVLGKIFASGTAERPVVFTSLLDDSRGGDTNGDGSATLPAPGDWGGVGIRSKSGGGALLHTEIRFGGSATYFGAGGTEAGLYLESPDFEVRESRIERSSAAGIRIWGGSPRIVRNAIHENAVGILASDGSTATVEHNDVSANSRGGIDNEGAPGLRLSENRVSR